MGCGSKAVEEMSRRFGRRIIYLDADLSRAEFVTSFC